MRFRNLFNTELKITVGRLIVLLVVIFLLSGLSTGLFLNFVFPHLTQIPGLRLLNPRYPVVINKTERVVINESINILEVYHRLRNTTVAVVATSASEEQASPGTFIHRQGTGLIVSTDGLIFTSQDIVGAGPGKLLAVLSDGRSFDARVLGLDPKSDLAVLKIEADTLSAPQFVDSSDLTVTEKLVAAAAGLGWPEPPALVVAVERLPTSHAIFPRYFSADRASDRVGVFPALSSSYEGAALVNRDGKVAAQVLGGEVVPGEYLESTLSAFLSQGGFSPARWGLQYVSVGPALARIFGLPARYGALVLSQPGSPALVFDGPAYRAGLREGDFI
ncbi:MAG: trypsin-like peptidase domain-containing protein, partial [Candidatus Doudnabacteria bacterium]|nr:trypsin-like peptidase domain-containing protein [Candidatus Doudnabacteria bacterium]